LKNSEKRWLSGATYLCYSPNLTKEEKVMAGKKIEKVDGGFVPPNPPKKPDDRGFVPPPAPKKPSKEPSPGKQENLAHSPLCQNSGPNYHQTRHELG
jgi:hypothetical protein